jgi:hypothetical protein
MVRPAASYSAIQECPNMSWNQERSRTASRLLPKEYTNIRKSRMSMSGILILDPSTRATNHIMRLSPRLHCGEIFRKQKLHNSFMLKGYRENYMLNTTKLCCFCVGIFAFGIHTKDNTHIHDRTPTQQVDKNIKN